MVHPHLRDGLPPVSDAVDKPRAVKLRKKSMWILMSGVNQVGRARGLKHKNYV